MNIPEKCKDCAYLKYIYNDKEQNIKCMLGHPFSLAAGCPNKTEDIYHKYND